MIWESTHSYPLAGMLALALSMPLWAAEAPRPEELAEAREHLQHGRTAEALEIYDELAEKSGTGGTLESVVLGQVRCRMHDGLYDEAQAILKAALDRSPDAPGLWAQMGELHWVRGRLGEAASSAERALKHEPDHPQARVVQAHVWAATGRQAEADEAFRWCVRRYNMAQPTDAETLIWLGRGAAVYARWHGATQIFDFLVNTLCPDALQNDPLCWQAHALAGELFLEKFNRAQGHPELEQALAINPRSPEVHAALARSALDERELDEAQAALDRALRANPKLPEAWRVQADLRLLDGRVAEAREALATAERINPTDEQTLGRVAACLLLQDGMPSDTELETCLTRLSRPDEIPSGRAARFVDLLREVARRNPHPGVFLSVVGAELESQKRFRPAERFYAAALREMPRLPGPKAELGMLYMRTGRNAEAAVMLDAALTADPYHVRVSNLRKVLRLIESYDAVTTEHFVIHVDPVDKVLARYMARYLEEEYPALVKEFGFEPETRTQYDVLNKSKGLTAHQWFSARMVGLPWVQTVGASTGVIVALASPTASAKPCNWARMVKHEFVHILTLQATDFNIPHWYTEALAMRAEGGPRPESWDELLLQRVPAGQIMNLATLNTGFTRPKSSDDWTMAYCQSRLYADYLSDVYGADKLPRLLAAYRRQQTTEQAIPEVAGIDLATFEQGYREYLDRLLVNLRAQVDPPVPPLAEAEDAHRRTPEDATAAGTYALALLAAGQAQRARAIAEKVAADHPTDPAAAYVLARLAVQKGQAERAVELLEGAFDAEHPQPRVLTLLAELKLKQGEAAAAARLYETGLKQRPRHIAWLKGRAAAWLKDGNTEQLRAALLDLTEVDADDAPARKNLMRLALASHHDEDAIRYGRMSLEIDVMDVEVHRELAAALIRLGRLAEAVFELEVICDFKPGDAAAVIELARTLAAAGRKEEAVRRLEALLQKNPQHTDARKALDELR